VQDLLGVDRASACDIAETWPGILGINLRSAVARTHASLVRAQLLDDDGGVGACARVNTCYEKCVCGAS